MGLTLSSLLWGKRVPPPPATVHDPTQRIVAFIWCVRGKLPDDLFVGIYGYMCLEGVQKNFVTCCYAPVTHLRMLRGSLVAYAKCGCLRIYALPSLTLQYHTQVRTMVTAMAVVDDLVWCGSYDGSLTILGLMGKSLVVQRRILGSGYVRAIIVSRTSCEAVKAAFEGRSADANGDGITVATLADDVVHLWTDQGHLLDVIPLGPRVTYRPYLCGSPSGLVVGGEDGGLLVVAEAEGGRMSFTVGMKPPTLPGGVTIRPASPRRVEALPSEFDFEVDGLVTVATSAPWVVVGTMVGLSLYQ
eukprot:Sspe_Gene.93918::Locus_66416_Transcript_1_2_Confidence_0.667_Length_1004::g.93918::m.93918